MARDQNPDPRSAQPSAPFREPPQRKPVGEPGREAEMRQKPDFGEESYRGLGRLMGRAALVTGGDSGIGRAVSLAFAREGADVAIAYLDEHEDANETRRLVEAAGRRALLLPGDLGDAKHAEEVVRRAARELGRLDVLVNNASWQRQAVAKFEEIDPEALERTFRSNIYSMFFVTRAALPYLGAGASIINVASIQAYDPTPSILDYASTKGAIVTFTKGLSQELIERGIRVNAVAPGPVWTPLIPQSFSGKKLESFGKSSPTGRPAQPAELAPPFVFLACDESRYVNGEILGVTGGELLA